MKVFLTLISFVNLVFGQFDPHFVNNRQGIVHLFEWKWLDIADECENFLGPKGFGGVQTSPVNENAILEGRPWFERYQPISYKIQTRSGTEDEFIEMIQRCRNVGVRIYVDIVVNHMASAQSTSPINGTGGSEADPANLDFPAIPFNRSDFHQPCTIQNYNNATEVRDCDLSGLPDLDQSNLYVREKIVDFINHLIDLGVAGFRMDACKHMLPEDLRIIYGSLKPLSSSNGFVQNSKPFIYQEVIDMGDEAVRRAEYRALGTVTEFTFSTQIGMIFRQIDRSLDALENWGQESGFLPSKYSFVFVCNHDNQRGHGSGGSMILSYKDKDFFTKASAFMLAHPWGENHPRLMSSYYFEDPSQGPPQNSSDESIISRGLNSNGACTNGWVCEHRWPQIANMIKFRAVTTGELVQSFTNIVEDQISFCRGKKGFIAINNSKKDLVATVNACLPDGVYCDVISGDLVNGQCTGKSIIVSNGMAKVEVPRFSDGIFATHVEAKPSLCSCNNV